MNALRLIRALWVLGGLAFLLAALREPSLRPTVLGARDHAAWITGTFAPDATFPATIRGALPPQILTVGSWIAGDQWQGRAATPWIAAPFGAVRVSVAGYPLTAGCSLRAEFRHANGTTSHLDCALPNPGEQWASWDFSIPGHGNPATAFRLVATDHAAQTTGWLAFSQPFLAPSSLVVSGYQSAQVLATLALALVLLWLPGLGCAPRASTPELRLALLLGTGPLALAALGLSLWLLSPWLPPGKLGPALGALYWLALGRLVWRPHPNFVASVPAFRLCALVALSSLVAVAKATYSGGPDGELDGGNVRRTLAVGNRSDSLISFYTAQGIQRHLAPTSAAMEHYYAPWTFFSRGPLPGLAASAVLFATGNVPPADIVTQRPAWEPFDATGFAACRIALISLSGLALVALFAVLAFFVGDAWAFLGATTFALCPFVVHETFFTWPKLAATAWILVSFLCAHQRRPFLAGLTLALGYLFHPLTLLWAPWLLLWALGRETVTWCHTLRVGARFATGLALLVGPWMAATALPTHLAGPGLAVQSLFLRYFVLADWQPATLATWLDTRWLNFSNTFLPFWLHAAHADLSDLNSVYHPAGSLVKFSFSWWNTLPLGLGLATWSACLLTLVFAARRWPAALLLLVVGPACLLVCYWGASPTGLMRECGHPLLAAVVGLTIFYLAQTPGRLATLARHRATPWLQLPETLLLLWLTTLANPTPPQVELHSLDPVWFTVSLVALAAIAHLAAQARSSLPIIQFEFPATGPPQGRR